MHHFINLLTQFNVNNISLVNYGGINSINSYEFKAR